MTLTVFAVIKRDGTVKRTRSRSLAIYPSLATAKGQARAEGDSVVEVELDLSRAPLMIRGQKVNPDG